MAPMAFIRYVPEDEQAPADRVDDRDHIIQIHGVHPAVMRQHLELYRELMRRPGPLSRRQRELIGVRVSALNGCHY
jgi:alkylhydroperoxidase family enzyme